jgi:DNA-binding MarR family transcriptional regulator
MVSVVFAGRVCKSCLQILHLTGNIMDRTRNDLARLPPAPSRQLGRASKGAKDAPQALPTGADPSRMWTRPGFLIRRLHQIHYGLFLEECGPSTITPLQFGMLTVLTEHPAGIDISALAFQMGTDRSNTADVARRLARRGYIKQETARDDRRKVVSRITKEGRAFLKKMEPFMHKSQERLLRPLSSGQRLALMAAMRILVRTYNDKGRAKMTKL